MLVDGCRVRTGLGRFRRVTLYWEGVAAGCSEVTLFMDDGAA